MPQSQRREQTGVSAIIHAFVENPVAAVQVVSFMGMLAGTYYAITSEIAASRASTELKIATVEAKSEQRAERLDARLNASTLDDSKQWAKIEALSSVTDSHHNELLSRLTAYEVSMTRLASNVEHLTEQIKMRSSVLDDLARKSAVRSPRP